MTRRITELLPVLLLGTVVFIMATTITIAIFVAGAVTP